MKTTQLLLLLALGLIHSPLPASGQSAIVPNLISYQGRVADRNGALIGANTPVNRNVVFRLYTASIGGSAIWAETQRVTISDGEFSVLVGLGEGVDGLPGSKLPAVAPFKTFGDAINTAGSSAFYLGVTVDDGVESTVDSEISPRQQIVSSAFALRAAVAESVASSAITSRMIAEQQVVAESIKTGAVTESKVADSAITSAKIANGAVNAIDLASSAVTAEKIDVNTVGLWNVTGTSVYRAGGNVGIQTSTPGFPLNFANVGGDKIALYGQTGAHYGFGIQGGLLQIHADVIGSDVAFGYGTSASFSETVRIKGTGLVGIGTSTPGFPLNFANFLGDKISLFGNSGAHYGFGIQNSVLQIHTDASVADVAFGYGTSAAFTETMRIKGNGNVGIGTNNPSGLLHINSNVNKSLNPIIISNDIPSWGSIHLFNNFKYITTTSVTQESFRSFSVGPAGMGIGYEPPAYNSYHAMYVRGWVGIQNNTPGAPLHVSDQAYNESYWEAVMDASGPRDEKNVYRGGNYGIIVDSSIRAAAYVVVSDKRLKKGIQRSDSASDMKSLLGIEVSDYQFVDTYRHGPDRQKKVIAQQIEGVYPQAISKAKGILPDIYKGAKIHGQWIHLETDLKAGDRVRLVSPQHDNTVEVLEVAQGRFRTEFPQESGKVLVYGREVDDLRAVDYDALSVLNISATQELHRQLDQERRQNASLKSKLSSVEDRLEALEKRTKESK